MIHRTTELPQDRREILHNTVSIILDLETAHRLNQYWMTRRICLTDLALDKLRPEDRQMSPYLPFRRVRRPVQ